MATLFQGRRIVRQTNQIVLNSPAVGTGANGTPYAGAQVTLQLPNALYGVLVLRNKSNSNFDPTRFGLQQYNRTTSTYDTNFLSSDSMHPWLGSGGGLSLIGLRNLPTTFATSGDQFIRQRLISLDSIATWYDSDANTGFMAGLVGLVVYHLERVQIGGTLSNIIGFPSVDQYYDLYEVY